jgi:hypothetical protein
VENQNGAPGCAESFLERAPGSVNPQKLAPSQASLVAGALRPMPPSTMGDRSPTKVNKPQKAPSLISSICLMFGCNVSEMVEEVQMTAAAVNKPAPLSLEPGHANEEGERRGMAAPKWGCVEIVNKNKDDEIIAVIVGQNVFELVVTGRDPNGYVGTALRNNGCMPGQTVVNSTFEDGVETMQIALYYGSKYKSIEKARSGNIADNFEFVKVYETRCLGKNVLLKYKKGDLEPQLGTTTSLMGRKSSVGGGIDMATNIKDLKVLHG